MGGKGRCCELLKRQFGGVVLRDGRACRYFERLKCARRQGANGSLWVEKVGDGREG